MLDPGWPIKHRHTNAPFVNVLVFTGYRRGRGYFTEIQGGTLTLESLHFIYVYVSVWFSWYWTVQVDPLPHWCGPSSFKPSNSWRIKHAHTLKDLFIHVTWGLIYLKSRRLLHCVLFHFYHPFMNSTSVSSLLRDSFPHESICSTVTWG